MLKKVLTVSAVMAMFFGAKAQELTQGTPAASTTPTEASVKNDPAKDPTTPTTPSPVYKVVGTDLVKIDPSTEKVENKVSLRADDMDNDPDGLYRVYSEKGGVGVRRKKFRDSVPHSADPFAWGDFSWLMGVSRKTSAPCFDSKYFTGDVTIDLNAAYSFANPIDNTSVGSTAIARSNELQLSCIGFGGDLHFENVRGRLMMQLGTRSTIVPRNDVSSYKGQYDLQTIYRYVQECYAGYHWNKWHGVNLDAGIFMSYIGLFSYNNFENWGYQASYTSDNTPWFFNGVRLQTFPTDRLKVEGWLINGWQSYGTFNQTPGVGLSIYYRPKECVDYVFNNYTGHDDAGAPQRMRLHLDYSYLLRYYNNPKAKFFKRAAFSLTTDWGFESGDGVSPYGKKAGTYAQNFFSTMSYQRFWLTDQWAMSFGAGYMHNPGQYLILAPTGYADTVFQNQTGIGSTFNAWDGMFTQEWDVNQNLTLKIEYVHRKMVSSHAAAGATPLPGYKSADLTGYFAGHGGVTGPGGYTYGNAPTSNYATYATNGGAIPYSYASVNAATGWTPDMSPVENKIIMVLMVRF